MYSQSPVAGAVPEVLRVVSCPDQSAPLYSHGFLWKAGKAWAAHLGVTSAGMNLTGFLDRLMFRKSISVDVYDCLFTLLIPEGPVKCSFLLSRW